MNNLELQLKTEIKKYFFAKKYGARQDTLIKKAENIKMISQNYNGEDKWINKFKNGETITNNYDKKLYFKFK